MAWRGADPFGPFLEEVASELGRRGEVTEWRKVLDAHLFDTMDALNAMDCEDWFALGLPLEAFALLKRRAPDQTSRGELLY